ncbi:MAG: MarR family winged helix-turn-helix transcriptional regulator [Gammaproteobacteria bacterium]
MSPPDALALGAFLPYRLSVLASRVSRELSALYAERFGVAIPEWRVIAVLGQHEDVSADFVCAKTDMDKVTVSRAVARLLEKKLVLRRASTTDRRRSMLRLSSAGRRVYAEIVPLARGYERQLLDALGRDERAALERALVALELHFGVGS